MKNLFIIKTGTTFEAVTRSLGDFEDWIKRNIGVLPEAVRVVNAADNPTFPVPAEMSGAVITGSHAMVTEETQWSLNLERWVTRTVKAGIPLLGICYGHQLLAKAMGGTVGYHPKGMEIGTTQATLTRDAKDDPLFRDLPSGLNIHTSHSQTVLRLPEGAVLLAKNDWEPHHAFRIGENAWGVQFHPEYDRRIMAAYVAQLSDAARSEGKNLDRILDGLADTPESLRVLNRFGRLCR